MRYTLILSLIAIITGFIAAFFMVGITPIDFYQHVSGTILETMFVILFVLLLIAIGFRFMFVKSNN